MESQYHTGARRCIGRVLLFLLGGYGSPVFGDEDTRHARNRVMTIDTVGRADHTPAFVVWVGPPDKWHVYIRVSGKQRLLGAFLTSDEAIKEAENANNMFWYTD